MGRNSEPLRRCARNDPNAISDPRHLGQASCNSMRGNHHSIGVLCGAFEHCTLPCHDILGQQLRRFPRPQIPYRRGDLVVFMHSVVAHKRRHECGRMNHALPDTCGNAKLPRSRELAARESENTNIFNSGKRHSPTRRHNRINSAAGGRRGDKSSGKTHRRCGLIGVDSMRDLIQHNTQSSTHAIRLTRQRHLAC